MSDTEKRRQICDELCKKAKGEILQAIIKDPQKGRSILSDWFPEAKLERNILSQALMEKVPAQLADSSSCGLPIQVKMAHAVEKLRENSGLSEENALWGVECWAIVLGKLTPDKCQWETVEKIGNSVQTDFKEMVRAETRLPVPVTYATKGIAAMGMASSMLGLLMGMFLFPHPDPESLLQKNLLENKIVEINSELQTQESQLKSFRENAGRNSDNQESALKKKKDLSQKVLDLQSEVRIQAERSAMSNMDSDSLKKRMTETSAKVSLENSEITSLQENQNRLTNELVSLRRNVAGLVKDSSQQELNLVKIEQEKLLIDQALATRKSELSPLEDQANQASSELKKIRLEIAAIDASTRKINAERQNLASVSKKPAVTATKKANPAPTQVRTNKTTAPVVIKKNPSSLLNLLDVGSRDR